MAKWIDYSVDERGALIAKVAKAKNIDQIAAEKDWWVTAVLYALGQGAPMIAAIWGVFIWKEFRSAKKSVYGLLGLMFCFFIAGLACILVSGN